MGRQLLFLIAAVAAAQPPDQVYFNGRILTVDAKFSTQQAMAIRGERIVATGSNEAMRKLAGPSTTLTDLEGRMVLPGLIDAHVHPPDASLSEFRRPLPRLKSYEDIQKYVRAEAAKKPKNEWVYVPLQFPTRLREMQMPTREVLDVAPDHPVWFYVSYVSVVNTRALQMNQIGKQTPDPPGGVIARDAEGNPNGILRNALGVVKVPQETEVFSHQEKLDALQQMLHRYVAAGLTSIGDRAVLLPDIELYQQLQKEGRLPLRVTLTWRPDRSKPTEELVRLIETFPYKTGDGDDWLRFGTFKLTLDGGMTIGTAYQRRPYGAFGKQLYGQTDPHSRGQLFIEPAKLRTVMAAARKRGWQLTAHSQGGGAIDNLLDAFEGLPGLRESRSHLMHASFQNADSISRAAKMGVLVDAQPAWLHFDAPALEKVFGHEGMRYFIPLKSMLKAGIVVAGGSDHMTGFDKNNATNPYNPFHGMWIAVTRKMSDGRVLYPEERVTREEALRMYTIGAAYLNLDDAKKGSLEAGKYADFVVIDRDYLKCAEDEIRAIEPVMTVIAGKVRYRR